jgi:hypothetical protein
MYAYIFFSYIFFNFFFVSAGAGYKDGMSVATAEVVREVEKGGDKGQVRAETLDKCRGM